MKEEEVLALLKANKIEYRQTATMQFKLLNSFYKNCMYYGTTGTLLVQIDGKNKVVKEPWKTTLKIIKKGL